ncbi:Curved DNA-binding protein [compost metagenome]
MPSHYETLGIQKTATADEIKKAFRTKAKQFHPDLNPDNATAAEQFRKVNEAYDVLKDETKRADYDRVGSGPKFKDHFSPRGSHWDDGLRRQYSNVDDHLFEELLRRTREHQARQNQQHVKNKDTILKYTMQLEDIYLGKEVELRYSTARNPNKTIKVSIPRSTRDGAKIRYAGMGDDSNPNAPPGDLYVVVTVAPNGRFVRNDSDISTSVTIDFIEAMLGVNKRIPCIDGSEINLRIHAGMNPGQSIKVPEKGLWNEYGRRGHMMVEVVLQQPKLNNAQYELLAKLKDL